MNDNAQGKGNPYEILMVQLLQTGIIAQQNFVTTQKIIDYDHLEYKRRLSLSEALAIDAIFGPGGDEEQ